MQLITAISPCPNDTYIFDAIFNKKIDTGKYEFIPYFADVEELNKNALELYADISKLSFYGYFKVEDKYSLLNSGSAMGKNCGPLLISKRKIYPDEISDIKIAIPGKNTTAFLLLNIIFPNKLNNNNFREYLFSDIEDVVLSDECDAGLIIHETRFTYLSKGLNLIVDLGAEWEIKHNLPIPLGGIAIKKDLPDKVKLDVDRIIYESILYANNNPDGTLKYIKNHSQIKDEKVIIDHINLYVNEFSLNMGDNGKKAVSKLAEEAKKCTISHF